MDIQPTNQQPISDDQELAKVLAGINQQANAAAAAPVATDTPAPEAPAAPEAPEIPDMPDPVASAPAPGPAPVAPATPMSGDLEAIKKDALSELRPLVDKLNVSAEEKFDTYLLLLRSTDDQALIAPAHEAAKSITDEARRAQALLDIIKEIDYLSNPQQAV
ncbi:hypothetical protein PV379_03240 [Streptomyces caniscabiei]|uniref:hypothetical protein n=1 Tax=Streptomyces caniscabiei TaxID=2746961 RepID=UPI0029A24C54|nr:hypothetical protein [Streptomyces caniscabiei]MDX2776357.1 hypothetical protein [Streptomyces caniscabiei]